MKREIKVKGRPIGKMGLWVYGIGAYKTNTAEHLIINAKGESIEVVNLCWWTGLKDKNGREIYEGDIVGRESVSNEVFIVEFEDGGFGIRFQLYGSKGYMKVDCITGFTPFSSYENNFDFVILSNIHDNPELLKGGDK